MRGGPSPIDSLFEDDEELPPAPPSKPMIGGEAMGGEEMDPEAEQGDSPMARLDAMQVELDELRAMLA